MSSLFLFVLDPVLLLSRLGLYATLDSVFTQYWNIYSLKINKGSSVHYYVGQIYINIPHRNKTELFYRLSCVWIETSLTNSRSNYLRSWSSELCYFWATKLGGRTWTPPIVFFFYEQSSLLTATSDVCFPSQNSELYCQRLFACWLI